MEILAVLVGLLNNTALLNNILLVVFYTLFAIMMLRESNNKDSPIHWRDMIMDKVENRVSIHKLGQFSGIITANWAVIFLVLQVEKAAVASTLVWLFPMWLAFISGTGIYNQYVKMKQAKESQVTEKE